VTQIVEESTTSAFDRWQKSFPGLEADRVDTDAGALSKFVDLPALTTVGPAHVPILTTELRTFPKTHLPPMYFRGLTTRSV
jgi:hypothetical protein